jgi:hypothetical protein
MLFLLFYFVSKKADYKDMYRAELMELFGQKMGKKVKYAGAFELCGYGHKPLSAELKKFFPLFGR